MSLFTPLTYDIHHQFYNTLPQLKDPYTKNEQNLSTEFLNKLEKRLKATDAEILLPISILNHNKYITAL